MPGYPIRTPWDHSLVDSSPRPIAASHVLHRLLVPRHPPFALDNLTTKMLASTVQFSTNDQPTTHSPTPNPTTAGGMRDQAMPGNHTPTPTPQQRRNRNHGTERQPTVVPSGPNRVPTTTNQPHQQPFPHHPPTREEQQYSDHQPLPAAAHQCLRHTSTPTQHPQATGSIPSFNGWCSLERR